MSLAQEYHVVPTSSPWVSEDGSAFFAMGGKQVNAFIFIEARKQTTYFESMGAGLVQWWERSPSTNVSRVRFPDPAPYVDWVCWFSALLREVFLRVLRFSPLPKFDLIWFDLICLIYSFGLQSPQLVHEFYNEKRLK